jgi:hypothetical protein
METSRFQAEIRASIAKTNELITDFLYAQKKDIFIDPRIKSIEWINSINYDYNFMTVNENNDFFYRRQFDNSPIKYPLFKTEIEKEIADERAFYDIALQATKNLSAILQEINALNKPSPLLIAFPHCATMRWDSKGISCNGVYSYQRGRAIEPLYTDYADEYAADGL